MVVPTAKQTLIRDSPELSMLVVAPAGCGKTEALALRIAGLIQRDQVRRPRRILVVTFSKRARDNIRERLKDYVDSRKLQDMVTIANFHGLAARIVRAHGNVIGVEADAALPDSDWVAAECRLRGLGYDRTDDVRRVLRSTKLQPFTDEEVLHSLREHGDTIAESIEFKRREEGRLTYEDLLRHAEVILQNEAVADIYAQHFECVIVDEFQDLTLQQLRLVRSIGGDKVTYAGDLAQGIYSFSGAAPNDVYESLLEYAEKQIVFAESHRSSPAVLELVNGLRNFTGGEHLTCAAPEAWSENGLGGVASFTTTETEAQWVYKFAAYVLERAPTHRVGVICRTAGRRRFVDEAFKAGSLPWHRWDDPLLDRETANATRRILSNLKRTSWQRAENPTEFLMNLADAEALHDPDTRTSLREALEWVHDELLRGAEATDLLARIKVGDSSAFISAPGVHLLSGHAGKGQQFDWVCVVGAEEGVLPFFKATSAEELAEEARVLSVMISRARHGALVLHSKSVADSYGRTRSKEASRFTSSLKTAPLCRSGSAIVEWLKAADWQKISAN